MAIHTSKQKEILLYTVMIVNGGWVLYNEWMRMTTVLTRTNALLQSYALRLNKLRIADQ